MICLQAIFPGATGHTRPGLVAICVPAVVANCTCCSCSLTFRTSATQTLSALWNKPYHVEGRSQGQVGASGVPIGSVTMFATETDTPEV